MNAVRNAKELTNESMSRVEVSAPKFHAIPLDKFALCYPDAPAPKEEELGFAVIGGVRTRCVMKLKPGEKLHHYSVKQADIEQIKSAENLSQVKSTDNEDSHVGHAERVKVAKTVVREAFKNVKIWSDEDLVQKCLAESAAQDGAHSSDSNDSESSDEEAPDPFFASLGGLFGQQVVAPQAKKSGSSGGGSTKAGSISTSAAGRSSGRSESAAPSSGRNSGRLQSAAADEITQESSTIKKETTIKQESSTAIKQQDETTSASCPPSQIGSSGLVKKVGKGRPPTSLQDLQRRTQGQIVELRTSFDDLCDEAQNNGLFNVDETRDGVDNAAKQEFKHLVQQRVVSLEKHGNKLKKLCVKLEKLDDKLCGAARDELKGDVSGEVKLVDNLVIIGKTQLKETFAADVVLCAYREVLAAEASSGDALVTFSDTYKTTYVRVQCNEYVKFSHFADLIEFLSLKTLEPLNWQSVADMVKSVLTILEQIWTNMLTNVSRRSIKEGSGNFAIARQFVEALHNKCIRLVVYKELHPQLVVLMPLMTPKVVVFDELRKVMSLFVAAPEDEAVDVDSIEIGGCTVENVMDLPMIRILKESTCGEHLIGHASEVLSGRMREERLEVGLQKLEKNLQTDSENEVWKLAPLRECHVLYQEVATLQRKLQVPEIQSRLTICLDGLNLRVTYALRFPAASVIAKGWRYFHGRATVPSCRWPSIVKPLDEFQCDVAIGELVEAMGLKEEMTKVLALVKGAAAAVRVGVSAECGPDLVSQALHLDWDYAKQVLGSMSSVWQEVMGSTSSIDMLVDGFKECVEQATLKLRVESVNQTQLLFCMHIQADGQASVDALDNFDGCIDNANRLAAAWNETHTKNNQIFVLNKKFLLDIAHLHLLTTAKPEGEQLRRCFDSLVSLQDKFTRAEDVDNALSELSTLCMEFAQVDAVKFDDEKLDFFCGLLMKLVEAAEAVRVASTTRIAKEAAEQASHCRSQKSIVDVIIDCELPITSDKQEAFEMYMRKKVHKKIMAHAVVDAQRVVQEQRARFLATVLTGKMTERDLPQLAKSELAKMDAVLAKSKVMLWIFATFAILKSPDMQDGARSTSKARKKGCG